MQTRCIQTVGRTVTWFDNSIATKQHLPTEISVSSTYPLLIYPLTNHPARYKERTYPRRYICGYPGYGYARLCWGWVGRLYPELILFSFPLYRILDIYIRAVYLSTHHLAIFRLKGMAPSDRL